MSALAAELVPFVALGALGSLHCAGMCGAFAVAVSEGGGSARGAAARRQAGYVLGKATTYAMLGLALSAGVSRLAAAGLSSACAFAAGGVLVVLGLRRLGLLPRLPAALPAAAEHRLAPLRRLARELARLPGLAGAFGAGAANGLIPCGLSFAAVALAAESSPPAAVLGPFLFGLSTAPALLALGVGAGLLRCAPPGSLRRRAAPLLIGLLLVAGGIVTALRGAPAGRSVPCCEAEP